MDVAGFQGPKLNFKVIFYFLAVTKSDRWEGQSFLLKLGQLSEVFGFRPSEVFDHDLLMLLQGLLNI